MGVFRYPHFKIIRITNVINPPINAVAGRVITHAHTRFLARDQFTAERLFAAPTPIIDEDIICVVLTGAPIADAASITNAADVSAAKPIYRLKLYHPLTHCFYYSPSTYRSTKKHSNCT